MASQNPVVDEQTPFQALWVEENPDGSVRRRIAERRVGDLPPGEVLIRVHFSSLNYKDALSASGNRGVTRRYPHTPGIDAAGVVAESRAPGFQPGDEVVVMGHELGTSAPGGYGQYIRVPAGWVMPLPAGLSLRESMAYGTGGFTAALSVYRLEEYGVRPGDGEVLVTGATGGVGVFSVLVLARDGYRVSAATGKPDARPLLERLGAAAVLPRAEVDDTSGKPLLAGRWAGAVDTVGGNILATALRAVKPGGCVTACGNAASPALNMTVFPFILRGVALLGIDMLQTPAPLRDELWRRLAGPWKPGSLLEELIRVRPLAALDEEIERILRGGQTGRVVVDLRDG
ncbi:MAG TPA: YhdH/YhfP family quinone oxidoreductase [Anaerolineaceae bacterium]